MRSLIFLGTGNAMVTRCFNTCFLLRTDAGEYLLTDTGGGNGILRQLDRLSFDYARLHHIFLTHGHTDHVLGMVWIIRKIAGLIDKGKYQGPLHIYCHDVVRKIVETMAELLLKKKDREKLGTEILLHEVKSGEKESLLGLQLIPFDIHSTKAKQFGYQLIFPDGERMTCLGDEPYQPLCRQYAEQADWLLSEAFCRYEDRQQFAPYEKHHSTVKDAAEVAADLAVKNLVLYHTEDQTLSFRKKTYGEEAAGYYKGKIWVPDDLEEIVLA